jgi:hypothetical protein
VKARLRAALARRPAPSERPARRAEGAEHGEGVGRVREAAIGEEEHAPARAVAKGDARVDLLEERAIEGLGVEPVRAEIAGDAAEELGAGEAAGVVAAIDDPHPPASPGEEQRRGEAGDARADDEVFVGGQTICARLST